MAWKHRKGLTPLAVEPLDARLGGPGIHSWGLLASAFGLLAFMQMAALEAALSRFKAKDIEPRILWFNLAPDLRERSANTLWSMFSRLPECMTAGKNREAVLPSINRLRKKLTSVRS